MRPVAIEEQHVFFLVLSASPANLDRLRRLGVCIYSDTITELQRTAIWAGLEQVPPNDPEQYCFVSKYSTDGGATHTHYVGVGQISAQCLDRLGTRIGLLATLAARFARFDAETGVLTADHNIPALSPFVGHVINQPTILGILGLTLYRS